jgi:anti-sigma-K factor RskA
MSAGAAWDEEAEMLAAEYALGLLEGEELLAARGRVRSDRAFGDAVAAWEERLAPLLLAVPDVQPGPELWQRIGEALDAREPDHDTRGSRDNVVHLRRREKIWQALAGGMTAVAASLALLIAFRWPDPAPPPQAPAQPAQAAPIYVASLASEEGAAALTVAVAGDSRTLVVTPARLTPAAGHDHELWLLPVPGANPISLGLVRGADTQRLALPPQIAAQMQGTGAIALSVEPTGGSPTGLPTGPVIASGPLVRI